MKKIKAFLILVFLISLSLPMIFLNTKTDQVSLLDNRKLVEFPKYEGITSNYLNDISKYLDDRYGARELVVNSYVEMNDKIFNELVHPSYEYGKDNHIFFRAFSEQHYGEYHKNFIDYITKMRDYIESNGSKFYVMINPEKSSVYTEYLPSGLNYNRKWIEQFEEELEKNKISFIDNTELLKMKSKTEVVYNRKFDAGHWNDLGAFYGVNNLLDLISKDFPQVEKLSFDDFDIREKEEQYLLLSKFEINEKTPEFLLKNDAEYENLSTNFTDIELDSNYSTFSYLVSNNSKIENLPKALVYQGSYLNGREKYLKSRFSNYIAIHNYQNVFNVEEHFEKFDPDIVVFEIAEYTFDNHYFSQERMKNFR